MYDADDRYVDGGTSLVEWEKTTKVRVRDASRVWAS